MSPNLLYLRKHNQLTTVRCFFLYTSVLTRLHLAKCARNLHLYIVKGTPWRIASVETASEPVNSSSPVESLSTALKTLFLPGFGGGTEVSLNLSGSKPGALSSIVFRPLPAMRDIQKYADMLPFAGYLWSARSNLVVYLYSAFQVWLRRKRSSNDRYCKEPWTF